MIGTTRPSGALTVKKINPAGPGLAWKIRNFPHYFRGAWRVLLALLVARITQLPVMYGQLAIRIVKASGEIIDYGVVSYRVVATAGVTFIAADIAGGANDSSLFKYHGVGTGTTAEASGDTALVTESTTALNPDSTRATGSQSSSTNTYTTVGTNTFDASAAITEHGIFSQAATGGGTLLDRSVFSAINVVSGDSLQTTYVLTLSAGG